jgi:hypothetical protein
MKTRTGFVSNSSTASFVMLGWKLPEGKIDYETAYEQLEEVKGSFLHYDDNALLIGAEIMEIHSDDGYAESGEMSIVEATERALEIGRLANIDTATELKLYYGMRSA